MDRHGKEPSPALVLSTLKAFGERKQIEELEARLTRELAWLETANGEAWTEIAGNIAALTTMITKLKEAR